MELKKQDLELEAKKFFETYKKEVGRSIREGERVVNLNFAHLAEFSPVLAEKILEFPEETLALLETALDESSLIVENPRIRLLGLPASTNIQIRKIRAKHLDQIISVEGIVRQASEVRPQVINARFECPSCGAILSVLQIDKKFREPSRCSCGRKGLFKLLSKEMVDAQRLIIEESPDSLEGGEQPRRISVFLKEDLVDPKMEERTTPGSRIKIFGVLKEIPVPLQTGSISTRFDLAIEANNAIPLEETFEDLQISEEEEKQILELASDPEVYKKLSQSIAPSVYGFEKVKEAILLQLFSGIKKTKSDGVASRGDIHILLVGDPGVAKSIGKNDKILYISKKEAGYKSIENLFNKFGQYPKNLEVLTIDQISHEPKWEKVSEIIKHLPEKTLINVKTEHGRKITATKDHSFITLSETGDIMPIKGEKLNKNIFLPIPVNYHKKVFDYFSTKHFNIKRTNVKLLPEKIKLDRDFGFFIGIFLSEGYIKAEKTIEISNKNKEIQKRVIKFAKKVGLKCVNSHSAVLIFSKILSDILNLYCYNTEDKKTIIKGVKGNYSRIKKIPEFFYFAPKEFIYGLLSGIFSGDGRLIKDKKMLKGFELITTSEKLSEGTSDLLLSLGIINKIAQRNYMYKNKKTNYYSVAVPTYMIKNFTKNIEIIGRELGYNKRDPIYSYKNQFPCGELLYKLIKKLGYNSRKNGDRSFAAMMRTVKNRNKIGRLRLLKIIDRIEKEKKLHNNDIIILKKIANGNLLWSRITNISEIIKDKEPVYDLSIPSTNTFVANGIGVHNSVTLKFVSMIAPKGRYVSGKAATGAGLTAAVVKDEFLKGWSLEAGAMVLSNKGTVCLDEIEKMDEHDRSTMHESMEQQCMLPDFKLMLSNGEETEIGKLVDNLIEKNKHLVIKGKDCEILPVNNIELISTDFNNQFHMKAGRVSRHIAPEEFVRIELANGREIIVTPEHPCWIVKNGKITTIPAEKLEKGEFFPIAAEINISSKKYESKNDLLCKILGYHISDGCYELNRGKKTGIQFCNNNENLIQDYKLAIKKYFKINPIITKSLRLPHLKGRGLFGTLGCKQILYKNLLHRKLPLPAIFLCSKFFKNFDITKRGKILSVRVISKRVLEEIKNIDSNLLEKGDIKKIPQSITQLPKENIKYLLRALYDGDGSVSLQKRNGCRISFVSQNKKLEEQIADLLLRFGIQSSIFKDKNVWRLDISGQENLSKFLREISFLSAHKKQRLKEYCSIKKTFRTITDIPPNCTDKINKIFKELKIPARKEIGHSVDLGAQKHRRFLQKLILIAEKYASLQKNKKILFEIEELKKIAFGFARWSKVKKVSKIKNKGIKWVYDVTIEPYKSFISNGMILHNTVTISKANIQATLRSETSVLAAGNPKLGRFDPYTPIPQQIDISPALLSRFDVIFILRDLPNKEQDEAIASHVLDEHKSEVIRDVIKIPLLRKYISFARKKVKPKLTDKAVEEIKRFYIKLRNQSVSSESAIKPIPITARQLEAIIRLSEACAKVRLSEEVTKEDAKRAIELLKYSLTQVGYDEETKTFDIDKITTGIPSSKRGKIVLLKETISKLESRVGKLIPFDDIKKELEGKMSESEIEEAVNQLSKDGDIFKPKQGYIQKL